MERYVDSYNFYVKKVVENQNHPRMMFMSVVHKLGLTDDGHCLLADGTHFDYPNDSDGHSRSKVKIAVKLVSHRSISKIRSVGKSRSQSCQNFSSVGKLQS